MDYSGLVNGYNHTKCISISNQKCMTQPTLINLHSNECSQEFHYYSFAVKSDRYVGSCNTLNDLLMMKYGLTVWLGVGFGQYLHFFCFSIYCYVTCLFSLYQPIMVSCLRCKNLWIFMMTPIVCLFTLGKPFMSFSHM